MRRAARDDIWRRLAIAATRDPTIRRIAYENFQGFEPDTLTISSPITALCGANGVGKTALLKALWAALDWEAASKSKGTLMRLGPAHLRAHVLSAGEEFEYGFDLSQPALVQTPEIELEVIHIDASAIATQLQAAFLDKEDVTALLNGVDPIPLTPDQIEDLAFLVGKNYSDLKIYEVEEGGRTLPFFTAVENGVAYDCRTMGLGEICLLYVFWQLLRATTNSITLLEEPESFISPTAQAALMDLIARAAVEKRLTVILTTHSPNIIRRLPADGIKFIFKTPTGARVAAAATRESALKRLGLRPELKTLLVVEDGVSREFAKLWIGKHDADFLDRVEIVDVAGATAITAARAAFPSKAQMTRLVGLYDGDQEGRIVENAALSPFAFLPGGRSIEHMFRARVTVAPGLLAENIDRDVMDVSVVLAELAGNDDHDWLVEFARRLGITFEQAMMALFKCWLTDPANAAMSQTAFASLSTKLA